MSTANNNSSRGHQPSARTSSPQRGPSERRQLLSPTTVGSVYPALENLQRISRGHPGLPPPATFSGGGGDTAGGGSTGGGHYQRHGGPPSSRQPPPTSSSSSSSVQGPAIVSHQALPTYRQASVTSDGATPSAHPSSGSESPPYHNMDPALPDILYSHMVPQVPPARPNQHRQHRNRSRRAGEESGQSRGGHRHRHRNHGDRSSRHHRRSRTQSSSSAQTQEGTCKEPCVKCVVTITSFRWVLVVLSVLGVCCVVTGIVLAALHAAGNSFLFLAIMFIGLGVLLVIVVGVGWKCTPRGHEPLHALFGIGSFRHGQTRERRHRRHRNRDGNWFGGVLYPEFQYRRPPPSYAASMQDYQNQVRQEQDQNPPTSAQGNGESVPSSPPPSYRSRASTAHSGIHIAFPPQDGDQPNSRPPTYRSRAPSRRPSIPIEETPRSSTGDSDNGDRAPPDVSFAGSSSVQISHDNEVTAKVVSSSSSPSHLPVGASVTTVRSERSSPPASSSVTMQVYTMPLTTSSQAENQNSSPLRRNTQNTTSEMSQGHQVSSTSSSPSSTSPPHQSSLSVSRSGARIPTLHQRMASEDRQILEQTLQSLEDHMNESGGITNQGASFDEQDHAVDDVNTRL